ncbi:MAG: ATP-binding protein, partial [Bacteroidota bacterium]
LYAALEALDPGAKTLLRLNHNLHLAMSATELVLQGKSIKLVALHNIVSELQQKEIDAWQNLTRVLRHEIMNSVTPISSLTSTMKDILAEDLEDHTDDEKKISKDTLEDIQLGLDTIQNRSQGLIRFVDAYRNITNIPEPEFQHVPLKDLLARTEQLMRAEMMARDVTFEYKMEESLSSTLLSADPELIEQVLINLVKNAMEAVEGKDNGKICLHATPNEEHRVQVQVIDNGPGIIPEAQERIFVPFYTTKKQGSGIGLALSRQIMQLHNGSLTVESEPDQETVFTMHF